MMREIKFRGKDKYGVWHYGGYVDYMGKPRIVNEVNDGPLYALATEQVIPETLGQYTGLKDKNGVEIYEGDILRWMNLISGETLTGVVLYEKRGCFCVTEGQQRDASCPLYLGGPIIEFIGNIHDSPELLTPKDN